MRGRQWIVVLAALLLCAAVPVGARMLYAGAGVFIVGSNSVAGLAQYLAEACMAADVDTPVSVSGGGTARGVKALRDGVAQIAMLSAEPDEDSMSDKNMPVLRTYALSLDAVVPVVHPSNGVRTVSVEQLRHIFSGKYTNWSEVGGRNMPIVVLNHDGMSGTYEVWKQKVLGDSTVVTPRARTMETGHMLNEIKLNEGAVGYVSFARLMPEVSPLSVEGVAATRTTIRNGTFPLTRNLLLATLENPDAATRKVLEFFLDPQRGGKVQLEHDFIPASEQAGE